MRRKEKLKGREKPIVNTPFFQENVYDTTDPKRPFDRSFIPALSSTMGKKVLGENRNSKRARAPFAREEGEEQT